MKHKNIIHRAHDKDEAIPLLRWLKIFFFTMEIQISGFGLTHPYGNVIYDINAPVSTVILPYRLLLRQYKIIINIHPWLNGDGCLQNIWHTYCNSCVCT